MGPQISQMKLTSPPSVMDEPKIKTCVNEQAEDSSGMVCVKQSIQASISFHRLCSLEDFGVECRRDPLF